MTRTDRGPAWRNAAVFGLVVMMSWTVVVKYLAPMLWWYAETAAGRPASAPVMWDFWPLAHGLLAWLLWSRAAAARAVGIATALAEISIVAWKLAMYLRSPSPSFWKLLWLTNKLYVLVFFVWLFAMLLRSRDCGSEPTVLGGGRDA